MEFFLRLMCIYLLLSAVFPPTKATVCADLWTFHAPTGTCFRVFSDEKTFTSARAACEQHRGGPGLAFSGWLAGIHDANTDAFVKNLLTYDQKAFIGLYRPSHSNNYFWIDKTPYTESYHFWSSGQPSNDYAYITRTSWKTTYMSTYLNYICQTHAMFSSPTLSCEPMRIGAAFLPFYCKVDVHSSFGNFDNLKIGNSRQEQLISCLSDYTCYRPHEFVSAVITGGGSGALSTTMNVNRAVSRSDDRVRWDCSYHFSKIPNGFLMSSCETEVYTSPSELKCRHTVSDTLVISCEAEGVYPEADSTLAHYVNDNLRAHWFWTSEKHDKYFENNLLFYKSTFEKRVEHEMNEGLHKIYIFVFPKVLFTTDRKKKAASATHMVEFVISAPPAPPSFSSGNGFSIQQAKLTISEKQEAYLICNVNGGNPPVYETKIICESGEGDLSENGHWLSQNQTTQAKFVVSRTMNKKTCTCIAKHISRNYIGRSTVNLEVLYPVETISFRFNNYQYEKLELNEGEQIDMLCFAAGNPKPDLHITHQVNNGKTSKTLASSFDSESLSGKITLSGTMSGMYICSAHNNLNSEVVTRRIHLLVISPPQPCIQKKNKLHFSAILGRDIDIEICLYAYPPPESLKIARNNVLLGRENYDIRFQYTHPEEAMASVNVKIRAPEVQLGDLEIHSKQQILGRSKFTFKLVRVQAPSCPESIEINSTGTQHISLSWQPASDLGVPQVFTFAIVNTKGKVIRRHDVQDKGLEVLFFNVTDLQPLSGYKFRLSVRNEKYTTSCPNLTVSAKTLGKPTSYGDSDDPTVGVTIGVVILVVVILIVTVALVVLVVKRRRKSQPGVEQVYSEIIERSETNSKQHESVIAKDEKDTKIKLQHPACDKQKMKDTSLSLGNVNVYTNESAVRSNDGNENQHSDTILGIYKPKRPKPHPSPRKSRTEGAMYANCTATDETKGVKENKIEGFYKKKQTAGNKKKEPTEERYAKIAPKPVNEVFLKDQGKELVYIEVEIEPKKDGERFEIKHEKTGEEPVAYATVNFNASVDCESVEGTQTVMRTSL